MKHTFLDNILPENGKPIYTTPEELSSLDEIAIEKAKHLARLLRGINRAAHNPGTIAKLFAKEAAYAGELFNRVLGE